MITLFPVPVEKAKGLLPLAAALPVLPAMFMLLGNDEEFCKELRFVLLLLDVLALPKLKGPDGVGFELAFVDGLPKLKGVDDAAKEFWLFWLFWLFCAGAPKLKGEGAAATGF